MAKKVGKNTGGGSGAGFKRKLANSDEIPRKQLLITLAGGALLVYASFIFLNDPSSAPGTGYPNGTGELASQMANTSFQPVGSLWRNPETTLIERNFCVGSQSVAGCRQDRMHPFVEAFEAQGYTREESERFLGWDQFTLPSQKPIIDEQFVFENKGARFFGKSNTQQ